MFKYLLVFNSLDAGATKLALHQQHRNTTFQMICMLSPQALTEKERLRTPRFLMLFVGNWYKTTNFVFVLAILYKMALIVHDAITTNQFDGSKMHSKPMGVLHSLKESLLRIALVHPSVFFKIVDIERSVFVIPANLRIFPVWFLRFCSFACSEEDLLCTLASPSPWSYPYLGEATR
ncbi:hypothetical protein H5410_009549 [Solanum commersonii]|uniref:Uncharacterized protein n=1 Tax=Solanum commersonii TaxID=4109 RepID=A0A9J6AJ28_SOLCO|nr:hypothetical protein H5410_009549 [Solanum commersonii]